MNNVFGLVNPVYDMDTNMFKVNAFTKQATFYDVRGLVLGVVVRGVGLVVCLGVWPVSFLTQQA